MKSGLVLVVGSAVFLGSCGPSGPPAIQKVVSTANTVQIDFDPTQRTNKEMRKMAQDECSKRGESLKDVTVAPTTSATTSLATVYCE